MKIYNSIKDTEQVAQKLNEVSNGKIKTGVYHAKLPDLEKENLHKAWRCGAIKVVCATIGILFVTLPDELDLCLNDAQRLALGSIKGMCGLYSTTR